ncbi:MAG: hypothetical protein ACK5UY_02670 [Holosporales bacterium]
MTTRLPILACLIILLMSSGCIIPSGFPDPAVPKIQTQDIKKTDINEKFKLVVDTQIDGESTWRGRSRATENITKVLESIGITIIETPSASNEIKVAVNNVTKDSDVSDAVGKGVASGLTFGLVGSTVKDNLEMTVTISIGGKTIKRTGIKHALYTIIGNATIPDGVQKTSIPEAYDKVVEQMLLKAFKEIQSSGELSKIQRAPGTSLPPKA